MGIYIITLYAHVSISIQEGITSLCGKMSNYGLSEIPCEKTIRAISSLLDTRSVTDELGVGVGRCGGVEGEGEDGEGGEREGDGGEGEDSEREGEGDSGEGGGGIMTGDSKGDGKLCGKGGVEREIGKGGNGGEGVMGGEWKGGEMVRSREGDGVEREKEGEGEKREIVLNEEDRGWLTVSRQIMLDISESLNMHLCVSNILLSLR